MTDNAYLIKSYQTPNALIDELMPLLTPEEFMVVSFAIRHILGWRDHYQDRQAEISLTQFEKTGLGRATIIKALAELERFKILTKVGEPSAKGQCWRLAFDDNEIDIEPMKERRAERQSKNQHRTCNARSVRHTGMSHRPEVVSRTDRQVVCGTYTTKHNTKHKIQTQSAKASPGRKRDPVFDVIGEQLFQAPIGSPLLKDKSVTGRIGRVKESLVNLKADVSPDDIRNFLAWYDRAKKCARPKDAGKAAVHFAEWLKENGSPPRDVPGMIPDWALTLPPDVPRELAIGQPAGWLRDPASPSGNGMISVADYRVRIGNERMMKTFQEKAP